MIYDRKINYTIEVYIKNKLLLDWFISNVDEVKGLYNFNIHSSLNSLRNTLEFNNFKTISIVDIENNDTLLFTKFYSTHQNNYKFLGVGFNKKITDLTNLLSSNINGLLDIECSSYDFINAINLVNEGKYYISDNIKNSIIDNYLNSISNLKYNNYNNNYNEVVIQNSNKIILTNKEKNVCDLLSKGLSYKEIAIVLGITTFTVNQKAKSIFKKLNVKSRAELSYQILTQTEY